MYNVDVGLLIPFAVVQDDRPINLAAATAVDLMLVDGVTLPLTVTDALGGLVEYVTTVGALTTGFKRAHIRLSFGPGQIIHSDEFVFHVAPLFG